MSVDSVSDWLSLLCTVVVGVLDELGGPEGFAVVLAPEGAAFVPPPIGATVWLLSDEDCSLAVSVAESLGAVAGELESESPTVGFADISEVLVLPGDELAVAWVPSVVVFPDVLVAPGALGPEFVAFELSVDGPLLVSAFEPDVLVLSVVVEAEPDGEVVVFDVSEFVVASGAVGDAPLSVDGFASVEDVGLAFVS